MSILDLAKPAKEAVESVNMLLYGDSGVGKTTFCGSGRQRGKNDLIIAVEKGTISAARAGSQANVLNVEDLDQLFEIISAIENEPERFEWVCVDSITKLQDMIWQHIISKAVERNPGRNRFKRELQEYGEAQLILKEIIERLNASKANILYTATSASDVNEEAEQYAIPNIHGQKNALAAWVTAQMDLVCYMTPGVHKGVEYRRFNFVKDSKHWAKDRFSVFRKPVANLTLEKMTNRLLGVENSEEGK